MLAKCARALYIVCKLIEKLAHFVVLFAEKRDADHLNSSKAIAVIDDESVEQ